MEKCGKQAYQSGARVMSPINNCTHPVKTYDILDADLRVVGECCEACGEILALTQEDFRLQERLFENDQD